MQEYFAAPETNSLIFDTNGKVKTFTGGYVADRRVGNTKGLGALFGILVAIGQPVPGSYRFFLKLAVANTFNFAYRKSHILSSFTCSSLVTWFLLQAAWLGADADKFLCCMSVLAISIFIQQVSALNSIQVPHTI